MFSHPEQREALDEIIVKIRSGRMTRRTFLERAVAVGLSSTAAVSLLEACGGSSTGGSSGGGPTTLIWQSENDTSGAYQALVDGFNSSQKDVHVVWHNGPTSTDQLLTIYTNAFRARSSSIDVISIDVVYPAEFGANGWTSTLDDKWPTSDRANYLPGPIKSCTYQGKLYAAPFRTDAGVLYYRTDVIKTPPKTFAELVSMSKDNAGKGGTKYGYLWQGSQYEGLVCDFSEVLHGYGGDVLDANDPKKVVVNSPEALQALTEMVSWVGTISPVNVTTLAEETDRSAWQNGESLFMRNWPYAYSLGNASGVKIAGKFDITSLPYGGSGTVGHSAVGGWNLGISSFSKNQDASWKFIQYMLSAPAQKLIAIKASLTPTLKSVYQDAEVQQKEPLFVKINQTQVLENSLPRPVSAVYPDLSNIIQTHIHQALTKQASPQDALTGLQSDLQALVSK
ncbi:MAG: ABC transporter substrate-binding protein [Ktedonobacteraceae bacterium]